MGYTKNYITTDELIALCTELPYKGRGRTSTISFGCNRILNIIGNRNYQELGVEVTFMFVS